MKHSVLTLLCVGAFATLNAQEVVLQNDYSVEPTLVFYAPETPHVQISARNKITGNSNSNVQLHIATDKREPLYALSQNVAIAQGDSTQLAYSFVLPQPGFYRCTLTEDGNEVKRFNIGYEPESVVSLGDAQPDLKEFWDTAKAELAQVAPEYQLTLITDDNNPNRKLYLVKMKSLGGEEISGYYSAPVKKGKYPVVISYMGYGSKPWIPGGTPGYAEFVLSTRGQGLQEPTNTYGNWITYKLDSKEDYYYRGAFMDLVRAVDFVSSRPEVDTNYIFAEGGSQGGAFSLAAAALDDRFCAIGPTIPFLSDYQDYFQIVHWPAQPVLEKQKELGMSDAELYTNLSYFDIKNLAPWIKCPVIMGIGLQDEVCPPHTNMSSYNRISTEKQLYIYPLNQHNTPDSWWNTRMAFFDKQMPTKVK